ncbi:MAG: NF038122 family metalloprotease [Planctomycetota bacterium]
MRSPSHPNRSCRVERLQSRQLLAADFPFAPSDLGQLDLAARRGSLGFEPADSPLEIRFLYGESIRANPTAIQVVERAANQWRRLIQDPATVIIDVEMVALPPNILGLASSQTTDVSYSDLRAAMIADSAIEPDDGIIQSLPMPDDLVFSMSTGDSIAPGEFGGIDFNVNRAHAKALGLLDPSDPSYVLADAAIQLNELFFEPEPTPGDGGGTPDPPTPDPPLPPGFPPDDQLLTRDDSADSDEAHRWRPFQLHTADDDFDFSDISTHVEATMVHEIGHALGFVSSVDDLGFTNEVSPRPMDLFRFARDVRNLNPVFADDFKTFPRELRGEVNAVANFVEDTWDIGQTQYGLERGIANGGFQASHWLDEDLAGFNIGIMDPTGGPGSPVDITAADLRMMDLLGWDVPPPGETLEQTAFDPRILPQDVNGDGRVSPADALQVLNSVRRDDSRSGLDVNRDGSTTPLDALLILNHLRSHRNVSLSGDLVDVHFGRLAQAEAIDAIDEKSDADGLHFDPSDFLSDQL